ncbi:hypothetical protein K443DRAFT_678855, partial [Laccaria amethystina LaAM-08-1]
MPPLHPVHVTSSTPTSNLTIFQSHTAILPSRTSSHHLIVNPCARSLHLPHQRLLSDIGETVTFILFV